MNKTKIMAIISKKHRHYIHMHFHLAVLVVEEVASC